MKEIIISEIASIASENIKKIQESEPQEEPVDLINNFIFEISKSENLEHYKYIRCSVREILKNSRIISIKKFLRISILYSIKSNCDSGIFDNLPETIFLCQTEHLKRIASVYTTDDEWLDIDSDIFQKEIGITNLRLYVAGSQLIDVRCGVPRSIIFKHGFFKMPHLLLNFLKIGGFKPFFQIHTHKFNLRKFNEDGWNECYLGCSELYKMYPDSLGMFGASWFYDPSLEDISPRLAYLRKLPIAHGAFLVPFSQDAESIDNAISTSQTRKQLYQEGKYLPTSYMLIWPRLEQIRWSHKFLNKD